MGRSLHKALGIQRIMNDVIGLKRGTVVLKKHHKEWKEAFDAEKENLEKLLGDIVLDVQHIGSTAVPGLSAKPLIDMLMAVRSLSDVEVIRPILEKDGYKYRENGPNDEVKRLFVKGPEEKRTHHLHVTELGSSVWKHDTAFRDWLLTHPEDVKTYEKLKQKLAKEYAETREFYTKGKYEFIEGILKKAEKEV